MSSWHSHPKIYNLGHAALSELLDGEVLVQEKVDGSQFSFGVYEGKLKLKSKGQELLADAPEKMFALAMEYVKSIQHLLMDGCMYRAEYLQKPKHNTLAYDRVPSNNLILFDICTGEESYLPYNEVASQAKLLGLDVVPLLYQGPGHGVTLDKIAAFMSTTSVLGGQKIEGVVVKNYSKFGSDKKALMGKHVSEEFKEVHSGDWKDRNPSAGDLAALLGQQYRTPARWSKAVQHLRDAGLLEDSPKDIGILFKEVNRDVLEECEQEIKEILFGRAWPKISRSICAGLPDWYKARLLEKQFEAPVEGDKKAS